MTKAVHPKRFCEVPGCPRWSRRFPGEHLCGRHWMAVPKAKRRVLARVHRRMRAGRQGLRDVEYRIWRRCVRAAIENSVGLVTARQVETEGGGNETP